MSQIGGEIGNKADGGQYPNFQSSGGITPQQQALAQYDYGQNLLEGQGQFEGGGEGGGPIMSTMATQTAGGARIGEALQESEMSQANTDAQYKAFQNAENIDQQNQATTQKEATTLGQLAGKAAGLAAAGA